MIQAFLLDSSLIHSWNSWFLEVRCSDIQYLCKFHCYVFRGQAQRAKLPYWKYATRNSLVMLQDIFTKVGNPTSNFGTKYNQTPYKMVVWDLCVLSLVQYCLVLCRSRGGRIFIGVKAHDKDFSSRCIQPEISLHRIEHQRHSLVMQWNNLLKNVAS